MNKKALLPAAALLLVSLMPASAWSRNHDDCNVGIGAAQAGGLTPFSSMNGANYLSGGVNQSANGYDPLAGNYGQGQLDMYGNPVPFAGGGNTLAGGTLRHRCNSERSKLERAMIRQGIDPRGYQSTPGFANAINNPAINPFANPNASGNPYLNAGNPYGNANNPYAGVNNPFAGANGSLFGANNPYANPNLNPLANPSLNSSNPYANPNFANGYDPYANGFSNGNQNGFLNNATSASNLSKLGSILSGSGLGNLGSYAQNGNLNGGSLSGLRGLLGI